MIIKVWKEQDLYLVNELPEKAQKVVKKNVQVLVEEYGAERTEKDLGGYIAVVDEAGMEELKQHQLKGIMPEYIDYIEGTDYISVLFLCSSDFAIVVICNKELKDLIEKVG